jgi:hypothetical protein
MSTTTQTDDNEFARYLTQYLIDHQNDFLGDDMDGTYWIERDNLYKVICELENTLP